MESKRSYRSTAGNLRGDRSFSSTLLDAIYNSIDESTLDSTVDRRSRDRWIQKPSITDENTVRRRSLPPEKTAEFAGLRANGRRSLGSPDSSSSGPKKKRSSLKPIRTSTWPTEFNMVSEPVRSGSRLPGLLSWSASRHETPSFSEPDLRPPPPPKSAKSRAMKLYGDLKRMKQPISPGGKLASFLNSLFSAGGVGSSKKQRISSSSSTSSAPATRKSNFSANTTPSCSTASSYSRSCLIKRPSSAGKYESVKRSVRFCPVSVVVDEDLRPCGHKSLRGSEESEALRSEEKNRRVEMARDLLRSYQHMKELTARKDMEIGKDEVMIDDGDGDEESCCSSDLFELEIGVERFCEELPVFETTCVETNRAIASRLMA